MKQLFTPESLLCHIGLPVPDPLAFLLDDKRALDALAAYSHGLLATLEQTVDRLQRAERQIGHLANMFVRQNAMGGQYPGRRRSSGLRSRSEDG